MKKHSSNSLTNILTLILIALGVWILHLRFTDNLIGPEFLYNFIGNLFNNYPVLTPACFVAIFLFYVVIRINDTREAIYNNDLMDIFIYGSNALITFIFTLILIYGFFII